MSSILEPGCSPLSAREGLRYTTGQDMAILGKEKLKVMVDQKIGLRTQFRTVEIGLLIFLFSSVGFLGWLMRPLTQSPQFIPEFDWVMTDWSGNQYSEAEDVNPESVPGEVMLAERDPDGNATLDFVELYDPENGYPFYDAEAVADQVGFVTAEQFWSSLNETFDIYDFVTGQARFVATFPDDFGVQKIQAIDGKLVIPGADGLNDPAHFNGDYYVYTPATGAVQSYINVLDYTGHGMDMDAFRGYTFASTSQHSNAQGPAPNSGCILHSQDGTSFDTSFCVQVGTGTCNIRNIYNMTVFNGRMFVNTDGPGSNGICPAGTVGIITTTGGSGAPNTWQWQVLPLPNQPQGDTNGFLYGEFAEFNGKLSFNVGNLFYVFNEQQTRWEQLPSLPGDEVPFGSSQGAFGVHKGKLYAAGVTTQGPIVYVTDDPTEGEWTVADRNFSEQTGWEAPRAYASSHGRLFAVTQGGANVGGGAVYVAAVELSGTLISRPHEFRSGVNGRTLSWTALAPDVHSGTELGFQVRSASTAAQLAGDFLGPDGTEDTYYTTSGSALSAHHNGKKAFQIKVTFTADPEGKQTAILQDMRLSAASSPPPGNTNTNSPKDIQDSN